MWRRWPWRFLIAVVGLTAALWASFAPADGDRFPPLGLPVTVHVVDHGFHAGLVLSAADLRAAVVALRQQDPARAQRLSAILVRTPDAFWFEVGWGERDVYQTVRQLPDVTAGMATRALLWPTPSVVQVVPLFASPDVAFPVSDRLAIDLSAAGFRAMVAGIADTMVADANGNPAFVGPSLYGSGAFFHAGPSYHLFRTCNQWVSAMLRHAGVPSSWFWSMTSRGLMTELRWRTD